MGVDTAPKGSLKDFVGCKRSVARLKGSAGGWPAAAGAAAASASADGGT